MLENSIKILENIGFQKIGSWKLIVFNNNLEIEYEPEFANDFKIKKNALYSFVVENEVKYIGKTKRTISQRFQNYKKPGSKQSTNIANNSQIREAIKAGKTVEIYVAFNEFIAKKHNMKIKFCDYFEINLAAGLEDSLIEQLGQKWTTSNVLK